MNSDSERTLLLEYDYNVETPPSVAVTRAIATVEEVDPADLAERYGETVFDSVDPDRFDILVRNRTEDDNFEIEFPIYDYRVRVEDSTRILVYDDEE